MYSYIYMGIFIIGLIIMMNLLTSNSKKIDRTHWTIVLLLQFSNFGYLELSTAKTLDAAVMGNTLLFLGGTLLPTVFVISLLQSLKINVKHWVRHFLYSVSIAMLMCVRYGSLNGLFFRNFSMSITERGTLISYDSGIMLRVHNAYIFLLVIVMTAALLYTRRNRKKYDSIVAKGYMFVLLIMFSGYTLNSLIEPDFQLLPVVYVISFLISGICFKLSSRYIADEVASSLHESKELLHGHLLVQDNYVILNANEKALEMIPELDEIGIVKYSGEDSEKSTDLENFISRLIYRHKSGNKEEEILYLEDKDLYFNMEISDCEKLTYEKHRRLIIEITDVTAQQKYLEIVKKYNIQLEDEVTRKTEHIIQINEKLITAMADMVESRDPNTGGHIKRTSDAMQIITEEMKKDPEYAGMDEFFEKISKAAPMHDLGKIAVDDAILRKPGKFISEEYEIMKTHAAMGAEIVEKILSEYDDDEFKKIAQNVAHYHHERVDGSGYPMGLSGDEIPFEAKIMAVIDVYDALVSKRCYKDSFSFEKAYSIIDEGMGTQFDIKLKKYFDAIVPKLEKYYSDIL